ncbi:5-carboxymethyl-2-hydroxymuconate Delta-isomerase [Sinomicrobium weinanense]|uniref:5-carboxymethyl-2-hydroxymuconate Delta-isomerase n=1 Tax=Sinomicrobium weinanense TaxID=2842200 RepID=A0A926JUN8_9FLAO|nr:5-carboxymethyl-2-hydroxymuconate Delta-isomerase [Sinomicrobium weinanense]MBC9797689.1 5-carboxymethyl-2-hydroxymuconate Delta-isomerase [Sinomicrobium weinanense]MBU3125806.1 5-carboxymethyl-2-hydroxymuconate Delta-isomerase [Sinomicrobium weinanense]
MPHFIIDCSANILTRMPEPEILTAVFDAANASGLFTEEDIKVRINPYVRYEVGGKKTDFIHVFGYILEGRTKEEKADLSQRIVKTLTGLFPDIEFIASSVDEFTKAGYCNRHLLT